MIFPELKNKRFVHTNLDHEARIWLVKQDMGPKNPLLDPAVCQTFVEECGLRHDADYTYGGWMESRSTLWRGSYLDDDERHIHLGVDYHVPEGTGVGVCKTSSIIRVDNDHPEEHGWGNRIIVHDLHEDIIVIFAHLDTPDGVRVGDVLEPGTVFARVGSPSLNGGWFPHLHAQLVRPDYYRELLKNDLRDLDGYGHGKDLELLKMNFPNPISYFGE